MWWREVNYWDAAVSRQAGWHGGGDQEAEGSGISTARLLSWQARCVLTLLCRVRLLTTTVVLDSALCLSSSPVPFFCLSRFLLSSSILIPSFSLFPLCLCLPPPAHPPPRSTRTSSTQSSPTAPPPCCYRIMALLTTQTLCGSGYGPAKSSPDINHFTGSSLQFRDGRGDRDEGDAQLSVD